MIKLQNESPVLNGQLNNQQQQISGVLNNTQQSISGKAKVIDSISTNYEYLSHKPQIEGIELVGNKTFADLNMNFLTNEELESLLK